MRYLLTPTAARHTLSMETIHNPHLIYYHHKHINVSTRHIAIKTFMGGNENVTSRGRGRHRSASAGVEVMSGD